MMSMEEVAQVIAYCSENKISYKQRLSELGVNTWSFYDAKRKYTPKQEGDNAGEFLQLIPEGTFLPNPREWIEDVLLRIPSNENNRDALRELLPDRWAKSNLSQLDSSWNNLIIIVQVFFYRRLTIG